MNRKQDDIVHLIHPHTNARAQLRTTLRARLGDNDNFVAIVSVKQHP